MIVQLFITAILAVFSFLLTLLPSWSAPAFLADMSSAISSVASYTASTSVWIPWSAIGIAVPVLFAAATAALAVKGFRVILSLFTGGGGGAA